MTRRRAPWLAVFLPLLAMGVAWAADTATPLPAATAPGASFEEGVAKLRVELAGSFEKAMVDCTRGRGVPTEGRIVDSPSGMLDSWPHIAKKANVSYPSMEEGDGHQAILQVVGLIDALGNPRFLHVAREVTSKKGSSRFGEMAVNGLRRTEFTTGMRGGEPVAAWWHLKLKFIFEQQGRMGNILSEDKLNDYVAKARKGDGDSQAIVAYLDSIAHEEVGIPASDQYHFLATAAAGGERNALLAVTRLLGACRPPADVESVLLRFAMRGRSDLELLHATRMLARGTVEGHPEVGPMLHGAANSSDAFVQIWAAGILATSPIESVRDPMAALESAKTLKLEGDPDAGETLAAAWAATGNFVEAVKAESAAIIVAEKLHWKDGFMQQRLAKYKAGQPWIGWLCDCDQLVPEVGL
jgi:hypothetical protein